MESMYKKNNFILCLIIFAIIVILLGIYTIHKYNKVSYGVQSVLTNEASLIYGASISISEKELSVDNMVNFLREKFIQGNYTSSTQSMNSYIENVEWYLKSLVTADNTINGAWFTINPDLFIKLEGKKITLQDFSFTSWYCRDTNGKIVIGPRDNKRITPEDDPYYFEAVRVGSMIITHIYEDTKTNVEMISIASPIYKDDGSLIGVAGIDISKDSLTKTFKNLKEKSNSSELYIFDTEGKYIVGTNEPSDQLISYINSAKASMGIKPSLSKILNGNWILIEDKNNKGPYVAAEVSLNNIRNNLSCILYILYGMIIILFISLISYFFLLNKRIPEIEPATEDPIQE